MKLDNTLLPHKRNQLIRFSIAAILSCSMFAHAATTNLDIPAQPLDQAIYSLAKQTGQSIAFSTEMTNTLRAPPVKGNYSIEQALEIMLTGSGLTLQKNAGGYAIIKAVDRKVETLPEVNVSAVKDKAEETAATPIKGYVAKRATTATKTDASILETPQAISIITRDELDMRNVQRDGDAQRYMSGVISENYGADIRPGYDIGTIRGFDASTTGMYRDGLRETNGLWSRVSTDISTTDRIEVLKGPSSVLYGQSEPAGVINKITKKPTDSPLRQIELQAGNFNRYQGSIDVGGPVNDDNTVLYRVIGLVRDSESQYKYNNNHRSKDDREVFAPSITLKPTDKTTLTLQLDYLHAKTGVPFTVGTATSSTHTMLGDYTYDKNERTQINYGYLFEHIFSDYFTVRQNLRVSNVDFQYKRMGADAMVGNLIARSRSIIDEQLNGVALDNQAQIKFDTGSIKHTALAGVDFQRSSYTNRSGDAAPATADDLLDPINPVYGLHFSNPAYTSKNYQSIRQVGLYLQDQVKFDDHLVLTLSGRKDLAGIDTKNKLTGTKHDQNDDKFTYRAGLAYVFDSGFAPYITHATSFNPSIGIDAAGRSLKPTTGKLNEIGLRYIPPGRNDSYTFSLYELTQKNVVVYNSVTFDALQAGEIRSRGMEFEVKTNLLQDLNLITAFTLQDVEITKTGNNIGLGNKGDSPIYVPKKSVSSWLDYRLSSGALSGLGIGGGVRYVGHSNGGDPWGGVTYESESYTVFDAAINYTKNQWRFALNINNLFDKQYTICGYSGCTWGYERTAIATARYNF